MQNLSNNDASQVMDNLNEMFQYVYKGKAPISRRIDFNELRITYPGQKVKKMDIRYLKNIKKLLSYFFASIERKPFIDRNYNSYAFEALWILLGIINQENGTKYRKKEVFANVTLIQNLANTLKFGKYIFTIPKYKQFIFDVKGYNLTQLTII